MQRAVPFFSPLSPLVLPVEELKELVLFPPSPLFFAQDGNDLSSSPLFSPLEHSYVEDIALFLFLLMCRWPLASPLFLFFWPTGEGGLFHPFSPFPPRYHLVVDRSLFFFFELGEKKTVLGLPFSFLLSNSTGFFFFWLLDFCGCFFPVLFFPRMYGEGRNVLPLFFLHSRRSAPPSQT